VNLPSGEPVFVKTKSDLELNYGDKVNIIGNITIKLLNGRTHLNVNYPQISLENTSDNILLAIVSIVRQQISVTFYNYLPRDLAGLLLGIVIGLKVNFSLQFLSALKISGVMHVIAASGMNITMVGGFFFYTFSLFLKRQRAVVLSILIIIFYTFLAGFQPSIIRACIMGTILFSSQIFGRQNYGFYSLSLTFLIMLILWPQFLTDIGFQLSFVSTLGLLFIPLFLGKIRDFASEDLVTTLSAQVASLPILLLNFGNYSIWSVLVNFLVLWTIPPLMVLGGLAAVVSLVFAPLSKWILLLCLPLLAFFESVVKYFAALPGLVTLEYFPLAFVFGYYLILISLLIYKRQKTSLQMQKQDADRELGSFRL
jgi:competence protein ComEC